VGGTDVFEPARELVDLDLACLRGGFPATAAPVGTEHPEPGARERRIASGLVGLVERPMAPLIQH